MGALKETPDFQGVGAWCLTPLSTYISVISWRPVLLVEETELLEENRRPVTSH